MASTCYQPIVDNRPYKHILNLDFQLPKSPVSSDATVLGCAALFNLSPVDTPCLMHKHRFQGLPAAGQSLSSGCTADSQEEAEVSDSDDDDLPSVRKIIARSMAIIDLTLDDDSNGDNDTIEAASNLPIYSLHVLPSSLRKSLADTADDRTTSLTAATPARKMFLWKNVSKWSPLYRKLQQYFTMPVHNSTSDTLRASSDSLRPTLTGLEPSKEYGILAVELSEISPEIPETPAAALENIRREQDDHSDDGLEDYNERTQTVNDDKRPRPSVFNVFTEDDDIFISEGQPSAKRRRQAKSSSSSICLGEVRTPLVVNSRCDVELYTDLKHNEAMLDNHEWQAQRIVGERQTPSGLEYEVIVQKTLWLPRAMLDIKLVRKYRAERREATKVRTRWSSRLQKAGSSVRQRR